MEEKARRLYGETCVFLPFATFSPSSSPFFFFKFSHPNILLSIYSFPYTFH